MKAEMKRSQITTRKAQNGVFLASEGREAEKATVIKTMRGEELRDPYYDDEKCER